MRERCPITVEWYDVELTARCVRPAGHPGLHRDGMRWFDDLGFWRPVDPQPEPVDERGAA